MKTSVSILILTFFSIHIHSQNLYSDTEVHKFNLVFNQPDYWAQLEQNKESKIDIPATLIVNDTATYDSVGVRFKGNSSYNIQKDKKPFNLSLDEFIEDQHLWGYETLNLNNCFMDPTFVREKIAYDVFREYLPAGQAGYVALYINDVYWGLYVNVEQVNRDFLSHWYPDNDGNLYKGDPHGSLTWDSDMNRLKNNYKKKTNEDEDNWEDLFQFINILNNTNVPEKDLPDILNIDRVLWYMALCNIFTNLDSYIYNGHNYYIYNDPVTGKFQMIPWDLNEVFGCFPPNGTNFNFFAHYSLFENENNPNLPLVSRLLSVPDFKACYLAHCRTLVKHHFNPDSLEPRITALQSVITSYVDADINRLYDLSYFNQNVTEDVNVDGHRLAPGLLHLAEERANYLNSDAEFSAAVPVIVNVQCTSDSIQANSTTTFTAKVFDAAGLTSVYLYFRISGVNFAKMKMVDDGTHGDAASSDSVYTCKVHIPEHGSGQVLKYYGLAENTDGQVMFYPEGAEFTLLTVPIGGELKLPPLVINEFMASNNNTIADPQGEYDDWLEIYNDGDFPTPVGGMYLSDDPENHRKWEFPDTMVASKGYLLVWIDSDEEVKPGLHASFNLKKEGEFIGIFESDMFGNAVIDSVSFGPQTTDISRGRYPNITGDFMDFLYPTPEAENAFTAIGPDHVMQPVSLTLMQNYPNPFNGRTVVSYQVPVASGVEVQVYNPIGQCVRTLFSGIQSTGKHSVEWDGRDDNEIPVSTGIYICQLKSEKQTFMIKMLFVR